MVSSLLDFFGGFLQVALAVIILMCETSWLLYNTPGKVAVTRIPCSIKHFDLKNWRAVLFAADRLHVSCVNAQCNVQFLNPWRTETLSCSRIPFASSYFVTILTEQHRRTIQTGAWLPHWHRGSSSVGSRATWRRSLQAAG